MSHVMDCGIKGIRALFGIQPEVLHLNGEQPNGLCNGSEINANTSFQPFIKLLYINSELYSQLIVRKP